MASSRACPTIKRALNHHMRSDNQCSFTIALSRDGRQEATGG